MPALPHLILPRIEYESPRRKTGFGRPPSRDYTTHGRHLKEQIDEVLAQHQRRRRPQGISPNLILRIQLDPTAIVAEEAWERCGLTLLSVDEHKTLVLFSSNQDLTYFLHRLAAYSLGPQKDTQKSAPHTQIFASIDEVGEIRPRDRIGPLFRSEGVTNPNNLRETEQYTIDIELWDLGTRQLRQNALDEVQEFFNSQNGRVTDHYLGESLVLLRAICTGKVVKEVLDIDTIALVDLPPKPSLTISEILNLGAEEFLPVQSPDDSAPSVCILDSGITAGHPLIAPAVGEATSVPNTLGDPSDGHGHGTMVAGLALYGDVEQCIQSRSFTPRLHLYSARVLNDRGEFDDEHLVITQMRDAIKYFKDNYNCGVYNISLGDARLPYRGGKVSPWASILDTLARDLDVVIVVSAGNYSHDPGPGNSPDLHIQDYPSYLLQDGAQIIEPATGCIVLTVGALAHSDNVPPGSAGGSVAFRPIARPGEPSPFTRSGPGLGGAIKPELCEYGGNLAYDGTLQDVRPGIRELSIISFHHDYLSRLFTTNIGTSFAAPRVAFAAARLFETFPDASANLIRALLVTSASYPEASKSLLETIADDATQRLCGYGRPDLELARTSDSRRVVLYADSQLTLDNFHVYAVPIPEEWIATKGTRQITVSLAFDPPIRHSRFDYLGTKMSFRLIRGKSLDEVIDAFRARTKDEESPGRLSSTTYDCKLLPKSRYRECGTLQKATFRMQKTPRLEYGDTYYLAVRCEKKWSGEEHSPQRYAVVVAVEHEASIDLYNIILQRVRTTVRVRA